MVHIQNFKSGPNVDQEVSKACIAVNRGAKVDQEMTREGRQTIRQLTKLVSQATEVLVDCSQNCICAILKRKTRHNNEKIILEERLKLSKKASHRPPSDAAFLQNIVVATRQSLNLGRV